MALKTISKIDTTSLAYVLGVLYAALGLFIGVIMTLFLIPAAFFGGEELIIVIPIALLWVFFAPVFYGVMGLVTGGLVGLVYNRITAWTGGIKIELT